MADTRSEILEACKRLIARDGLRAFRMQTVAREAGVSIGLLAYHFGDRDGLLRAALDHVSASTTARAAQAGSDPDPRARLVALLENEFGESPRIRAGSTAWNELRSAAVFDERHAASVAAATLDWQEAVAALVGEADPARSPEQVSETALLLTSLVEGLSGRWLTGQIPVGAAQRTIRAAVGAVLPRSEADSE